MLEHHIRALRAAERRTTAAIEAAMRKTSSFSLLELIRDRTRDYFGPRDTKSMHAHFDLNAECEKIAGPANGTWVPFAALTRDLNAASASAVIGNNMQGTIAQALAPASVLVSSGATVITTTQAGAPRLPVFSQAADASGGWINEGATYVVAEPGFSQIVVEPRTVAVRLAISRRLLADASVDIERELRRHLFEALMRAVDKAAIAGSGTGNEPVGLLNHPEVPVVAGGTNGAAPTWDHLAELEHQVSSHNANVVSAAFVTNSAVQRKLRKTPRASGQDFILADSRRILGYELRVSQHVPSNLTKGTSSNLSAIVFGNWSDYLIALWGPQSIDILIDSVTRSQDGLVIIVGRLDVGFAPVHAQSFAVMKDCITT
jgi:HK97 family phage major capsid protein